MLSKTVLIACCFLVISNVAIASQKGEVVGSLSYGGYEVEAGDDVVVGSEISLKFTGGLADQWAYFFRLMNGSANGVHKRDGVTNVIRCRTTTLSGGVQWNREIFMDPSDKKAYLTPFVGLGVSLQTYSYQFDYADSDIGNTSGTGYGPLSLFGVKIDISNHVLLIPSYHYEMILITSERGETETATSSGLSLALMIRF